MEHSAKFEKVKDYYDRELWDKARVANAVLKGWITNEEYEEIIRGGDRLFEKQKASLES